MTRLIVLILALLAICAPVLCAPAGKSRVDPVKVRRELRQILSAPEYNQNTKMSALDKWLAGVGKGIRDGVVRFFWWIGHRLSFEESMGAGALATVGAWLVVAGFIGLLGFVVWRLMSDSGRKTRKDDSDGDVSFDMPTARPLMKHAAKLAEAGDYKGAFMCAYLASIAYLDEIRVLRFERSRTNWEYMRELKRGGHERPLGEMQPLTSDFDRKIYGRETCDKEDYLNATAVYERLSSEEAK